jgi:hypothetical protein
MATSHDPAATGLSEPIERPSRPAGRRPAAAPPWLLIERLLRDRDDIWHQIEEGDRLDRLIRQMLIVSISALAIFGATMGGYYGLLQALSSAIKLPLLFLLTLVICLPALHLLNLFYGGRLNLLQVTALVLTAITVTATLAIAFAPISLFFLVTARDYTLFKILNVLTLAATGVAGLSFLVRGVRSLNALQGGPNLPASRQDAWSEPIPHLQRMVSLPLLQLWLLLYGFVGTQLGWTLRPFFGSPGLGFQVFRPMEGSFFGHFLQLLLDLLRVR